MTGYQMLRRTARVERGQCAHLAEIDERIGELGQLRSELMGHIKRFERWLAENAPR
jgi:hypothetical protein